MFNEGELTTLFSKFLFLRYQFILSECFFVCINVSQTITAWKVSKYGVIPDPYFPVFGLYTGKYGPEITPYLETLDAVDLKLERGSFFGSL